MTGTELALVLSPLCTVAVAYVGRQRLAKVEQRVDGHLDGMQERIRLLEARLIEARVSPAEALPLVSPDDEPPRSGDVLSGR